MMNKFIKAAAIILLLLFCFMGWLEYRQYSSWKIPVHTAVKDIVRVNTDAFIKAFVKEYGFNFSKSIRKREPPKKDSGRNTGIYFPGNVFIYNISSRQASTLFCTLPVYDLEDFKAHARIRLHVALKDSAGFSSGISADGKLLIACNASYISFAYSPQREKVMSDLLTILGRNTLLAQKDDLCSKLKHSASLITGLYASSHFSINFSGDKLLMEASEENIKKIKFTEDSPQRVAGKDADAFFSIAAFPPQDLFKKRYGVKNYSIESDSLLKYYKGYIFAEVGPAISQADTITTYEYDDNFEKVEKQTISAVKVPAIDLMILADTGMLQYLQRQQIVTAGMKLNKEIFPLYNVGISFEENALHFSTAVGKPNNTPAFQNSDQFLNGHIDVKKTIEDLDVPYLERYVQHISDVQFSAKRKEENILVNGSISFQGSALKEVIKIFKSF